MKRIIATTAMALMLSTSAFASDANTASQNKMLETYAAEQPGDIFATKFIGMRIYSATSGWDSLNDETPVAAGTEKNWDDIGEVDDIIIGKNGDVKAVLLGVGGFIGIGEKDIAVPMDEIKMVREEGDNGDYFLVVKTNKDMLKSADAFERKDRMAAMTDSAKTVTSTDGMTKTAGTEVKKDEMTTSSISSDDTGVARPFLPRPDVARDGYVEADYAKLTADRLDGARVYGANDEDVGEISKLVLSDDGKIKTVVIDVGGFLGMGEKPVGVTFDELQILSTEDGSDFRVYIDSSEDALKNQPTYKG